jgi:cellulose synthase/poly-beta-1,6-N-acetylglucosamine synthase-like glycosyltransferase
MILFLTCLAYLLAIAMSIPVLVLTVECFLALLPPREIELGERESCAVLIPAHNEELGLSSTLNNVKEQLRAGDRMIVVADNCTDSTPTIAQDHGAEVVVRDDLKRRGKGFALDAGIQYLKSSTENTPSVVVMLDADCTFARGSLDTLSRVVGDDGRPHQALYLMHAPPGCGPIGRVSAFAFLTKNLIRARGLDRLALSVPLTGSGIAFPWTTLQDLQLGSSEIVEDMQLGLQLVMAGRGPRFCESARVDSYFPTSGEAARQQRTRWEHGYFGQLLRQLPGLFQQAIRGNVQAGSAGLDLLVPPLSLLAVMSAGSLVLLACVFWLIHDPQPLLILLATLSVLGLVLAVAWFRFGRTTISPSDLLWIPLYAVRKLPIYLAAPFRAERDWIRTQRNLRHAQEE